MKNITRIHLGVILVLITTIAGCSGPQQSAVPQKQFYPEECSPAEALSYKSLSLFFSRQNDLDALLLGIKAGKRALQPEIPISLKNQITFNLMEVLYSVRANQHYRVHEKNLLDRHHDFVNAVCFSPDGKKLASKEWGGAIKLWDASDGKEIASLHGDTFVFSPDSSLLVTKTDSQIRIWDAANGQQAASVLAASQWIPCMAVNPDSTVLAWGDGDGKIILWNIIEKREIVRLWGHSEKVYRLMFSPDGNILASGSRDDTLKLWNVEDGRELATFDNSRFGESPFVFSPDGKMLANSDSGAIYLWSTLDKRKIATLQRRSKPFLGIVFVPDGKQVGRMMFSPDNTQLIAVYGNKNLTRWNIADETAIDTFRISDEYIHDITFRPDGTVLALGSTDHLLNLWDVSNTQKIATLEGHKHIIAAACFNQESNMFASGSADATIRLWEITTTDTHLLSSGYPNKTWMIRFSPNGDTLLTAIPTENIFKLWDVKSGEELATVQGYSRVAFGPDDRTLMVTDTAAASVKFWSLDTKKEQASLPGEIKESWRFITSRDGSVLAIEKEGKIELWNLRDAAKIGNMQTRVQSMSVSPDGSLLATAGNDIITLWNVADMKERITLKSHSESIECIDFNSTGTILASAGWDNTITLWDVKTGEVLQTLSGDSAFFEIQFGLADTVLASVDNTGRWLTFWNVLDGSKITTFQRDYTQFVGGIAFSPDGSVFASDNGDTIRLWNLQLEDLLRRGCSTLQGYLKNARHISKEDRHLCDDILLQ